MGAPGGGGQRSCSSRARPGGHGSRVMAPRCVWPGGEGRWRQRHGRGQGRDATAETREPRRSMGPRRSVGAAERPRPRPEETRASVRRLTGQQKRHRGRVRRGERWRDNLPCRRAGRRWVRRRKGTCREGHSGAGVGADASAAGRGNAGRQAIVRRGEIVRLHVYLSAVSIICTMYNLD